MTEIKERYEKTTEYERVVKVICDWCGEEMPQDDPSREDYSSHIKYTTDGYSCSDGGYRKGWEVADLCQSCGAQLRKLMESAGIKVVDFENDW